MVNIKNLQKHLAQRLAQRLAMMHVFTAVLMVACNSSSSFDKNMETTSASGSAQWLSDVQSCIDHLSKNKYVFGGNDLDCTAGIAATDCSGFINDVSQAYFPKAYEALVALAKGRPNVGVYYNFVTQAKSTSPLQPVASMSDLVAGDIIMWIYKGSQRVKIGASGHMMLVLAPAESVGTNQYRILIADSAESGHDQDTRTQGQTGLGMGYIYFKTDTNGFPIGYAWSEPRNYQTSSPIELGHFLN